MAGREGLSRAAFSRSVRTPGAPYAVERPQRNPQAKSQQLPTPACENCSALMDCTLRVRRALEDVMANAKMIFLDDTMHHQMDDERWIRVLQAIVEEKGMYFDHTVPLSEIEHDEEDR